MSAGKGDSPRPVNMTAFGANYDEIFRKKTWPHDPNHLNRKTTIMTQNPIHEIHTYIDYSNSAHGRIHVD